MGATPQPTVINTADPLKGKNSIPVIDRDPDPGSQILQRGALLETFFAAIHEQGKGFVQADYRVGDFIREHGSLLRDAGSVQGAITLRNNLLHPRARHINLSEKHRAAAALSNALQDLLPHLPSQLRAAAVRDPTSRSLLSRYPRFWPTRRRRR